MGRVVNKTRAVQESGREALIDHWSFSICHFPFLTHTGFIDPISLETFKRLRALKENGKCEMENDQ